MSLLPQNVHETPMSHAFLIFLQVCLRFCCHLQSVKKNHSIFRALLFITWLQLILYNLKRLPIPKFLDCFFKPVYLAQGGNGHLPFYSILSSTHQLSGPCKSPVTQNKLPSQWMGQIHTEMSLFRRNWSYLGKHKSIVSIIAMSPDPLRCFHKDHLHSFHL